SSGPQRKFKIDAHYQRLFKKGADIFPRNYFFVDVTGDWRTKQVANIRTCLATAKNAKIPYKSVSLSGRANTNFIFESHLAETILPMCALEAFKIHLPIAKTGGAWAFQSSRQI